MNAIEPVPRSLPRGRHAAAREVVLASQRGRLLEAMALCVAEHGYDATTVAQVIAQAGVSRKTFYEHFADKRACFLAAWETGTELLLNHVAAAVEAIEDPRAWQQRIGAGTEAFLEILAAEPAFARSFLIEVLSGGEDALARRATINGRFATLFAGAHAAARAAGAELPELPRWVFDASVCAASELLVEHVRTRGVEGLAELAPRLEHVHLTLLQAPCPEGTSAKS
jgi:AcrR family transcriptional regulator